jgi:adenosine deaminase/aminodeoxyfutalosine deaminase
VDLNFPKAELHLHLEGTVEPETLRELAGEWTVAEIVRRYQYEDFRGFLDAFKWVTQHLRTPEDYALVTRRLLEKLAAQNVRYAEIYFSAGICRWKKMPVEPIYEAIEAARREAEPRLGIRARWIFDAVRQFGPEEAEEVVRLAVKYREHGAVGIGIGGDEAQGPPEMFRRAYDMARTEGLRLTVHAGETTGPASIWGALRELGAERIGHGVTAVQDPELMAYLKEHQIPVEVNVTSNYCTGAVAAVAEHPVRRMFEAGLSLVINSDDPAMFHTSINAEYARLVERHGFSEAEVRELARNSFQAAFLSDAEKAEYLGLCV